MDLATGIVALIGASLLITSVFFRRSDHPRMSWNPKDWVPVWKQKSYYRPPGYWMMIIGLGLFCLGTMIITFVFRWDFR